MKVLIIATRQIGDVLLTTPLIRATRRRWPDAEIRVLGFVGTMDILKGNPDIDGLIEVAPKLGGRGFRELVRSLWRRYDLALVTQPADRAHLIGWIAARRRNGIVPATSGSNWWKKALLDVVVHSAGDAGEVHVAPEKLALLGAGTAADASAQPSVPPPAGVLPAAVQAQLRSGAVVIHVPSMWPYKQWPVAHYRVVIAALLARGAQVILTGTTAARDQECLAGVRNLAPAPQLLDLSGQLDFSQLSALLQRAALCIGPDTSVTHLAAATGIPTIAIFGPTNPLRWRPWPASAATRSLFQRSGLLQTEGNVTLLQAQLPCVPCARAGCENHIHSRSDCLVAITPERVLEQAWRLLESAAAAQRST